MGSWGQPYAQRAELRKVEVNSNVMIRGWGLGASQFKQWLQLTSP